MTVAERFAKVEALTAGGFVLVPVPKGTKGPRANGWNSDPAQWIRTPSAAREYMTAHPGAGVGLLHSESQTAALDLDHDGAALALAAVGVDLAAVLASTPYKVCGKRGEKPLFRVPDGMSLKNVALSWPDPSGKKGPGGRPDRMTIFELRGGPVQDVIPPSIHPDTGQPYTWAGPVPTNVADLPELPRELLALWERWQQLEPVMRAACPWAPAPVELAPAPRDLARLGIAAVGSESVVDKFNTARELSEVLGMAGYKGGPRGPWLYPGSTSGQAGVRLRPERTPRGAEVVMSWHAGDPLGDGKPRDAFSVWALLTHDMDMYTATSEQRREMVKDAARLLGLPEPERGSPMRVGRPPGPSTPSGAALPPLEWGEVRPLPPVTELVPSLPPELLPPPLRAWIQDEARAAGLPLEMIAGPVLIGAGGMIGARLSLKNAANAPAVPGNLWGLICGPPSIKKTHALNLGADALNRAQCAEFERIEAQRGELKTAHEVAAARLEGLEGQLKRAYKGGKSAPPAPSDDELTEARESFSEAEAALRPARYVVNDSTVEKLGEILRDNPEGVTLVRDEATAWLSSFDRSGRESDRGFWLEAANGTGPLTVDRLTRGTVYIPRVCAGVMGTIQPGPLADLRDAQRGAGDGLMQRFQVFIWPDTFPAFNQAEQREPLNTQERKQAAAVLDALGTLSLAGLGSVYPSGDGAPLTYTPEAQSIYDAWEVEHAAAVRDLGKSEAYRAHLGKQPSTFARLALVFHALDVAALGGDHPDPGHVSEQAAGLAADWCDYLRAHALKLWGEGRRGDVLDAGEVLRFVERGRICDGQKVSAARAVLAEGKAGMTGERLGAALRVLEQCGAARVETVPPASGTGRPSKLLRLNPDALEAAEGHDLGGKT